jgi:ATP-dependent helicase/nuclease subunit B
VQARFLLGPAGSGKTFRCLTDVRAALKKNPDGAPLVFLAPKQATFQLERQLLDSEQQDDRPREPKSNSADGSPGVPSHQIDGYTRLQIFSFERLAHFVFEKLGVAPPEQLNDEGCVMILRALLIRHESELKLFSKSARRPGFARQLSQLLAELQQHQFTPARLRALAQRQDLRPELRDKLHDLALLHEACANWLVEHKLQDANHLLDLATNALRSQSTIHVPRFSIQQLWLDGFAEMTPQELDLLAAILPFCENATLAFCLDESGVNNKENSWLSIWNVVGQSFQQCHQRIENLPDCQIKIEILPRGTDKNRFAENPVLRHLEQSWSQPGRKPEAGIQNPKNCVQMVECQNPESESTFAAREILRFLKLVRDEKNRFRDCAVLVRDLDAYHQPLARAFRRYEIPFFLDRRELVSHHPLAELTRSSLRTIIFDWRQNDLFAALKAGFCSADENEIDRLENESLARGWRGKKWREPVLIPENPELEKSLERLRQKILPPFENFARQLARTKNRPDGAQLAEALRGLWSDLNAGQKLQNWGGDSIRDPQSAVHTTVWEQMNSWLENLELAFPRESLPLRDWLPILEAGLANLTVGVIPPALDQVLIGAIDRARNPDLKLVLVLGVNETIFPATPAAQTILTDADRDELGPTASLGPNLREQLARERFYGYIACTRASEKLVATFSRQDADGKTLIPSPFITHLQNIFPALEIERFQNKIELADAQHANEIAPSIFRIRNWPELLQIPAVAALNRSLGELREPSPGENLSPRLAEKLFGATLRTSVSRLEEFAACPFRFFVRSGLRAEERKIFELDARERGSFQHDVLKTFHERLAAEGKRWRDLTPPEARELIRAIAGGLTENYRDGLLRDTAQTRFEARALAAALQDFIEVIVSWMRRQYQFDPAAAELDFGGEDSPAPAWEIHLGRGYKLVLRGRIDRIDLCRDENDDALAVVIDYKSSGKTLDKLLVEHGVQLQLPAYLNVLRYWENPQNILGAKRLIPAGVFYVNLRGQFEGGGSREEILAGADEARRRAYRHTGRFDAGALDKLDSANAADQFNFRRNQGGSLRKGSVEALARAEFEKLLDGVEAQLRAMAERIFLGAARVDPYRKGNQTPCEFCDYQSACRIDKWTHQYRVLRAASKEIVSETPAPS